MEMSKEFKNEVIKRLGELYDRASGAANKNITLRFFIDLDNEDVGEIHVMGGTEYRQQGNIIQVASDTGFRADPWDKKHWMAEELYEIKQAYEMKDWKP